MYTHEHHKRVRYGETDQMGYLYYGNYAQYYEIGRVEMLRALGITYRDMEAVHRVMMPVLSLEMRFVRPALYDELLTIRTTLRKPPEQYIVFHMDIFNERRELLNGGSVRLCFVDMDTHKTIAAPGFLLDKLKPYFEKADDTHV